MNIERGTRRTRLTRLHHIKHLLPKNFKLLCQFICLRISLCNRFTCISNLGSIILNGLAICFSIWVYNLHLCHEAHFISYVTCQLCSSITPPPRFTPDSFFPKLYSWWFIHIITILCGLCQTTQVFFLYKLRNTCWEHIRNTFWEHNTCSAIYLCKLCSIHRHTSETHVENRNTIHPYIHKHTSTPCQVMLNPASYIRNKRNVKQDAQTWCITPALHHHVIP